MIALSSPPHHAVHARMWQSALAARAVRMQQQAVQLQQEFIRQAGQHWSRFQQEVLAELSRAPNLPPPPNGRPDPTSVVPPLYLYHGTSRRNMASIYARGIEGRSGGWAFAARDYATAKSYGQGRGGRDGYVIFRIHAQRAYQQGVCFGTSHSYFITRNIHPAFIDFHWALVDMAHPYGMHA